jgi:hypothetical protein
LNEQNEAHGVGGLNAEDFMLTMVIGAAFCCVPLAVLFERFAPPRRLPQPWAANDNFSLQERPDIL